MPDVQEERPTKRAKLLDDSGLDTSSDNEEGGVPLNGAEPAFKINEEYARRFEHNQRRTERQRLEEKYKSSKVDDGDESSTDEEEDDEGILASGVLDDEVNATLKALQSKDPRVYDKTVKFYTAEEDGQPDVNGQAKPSEKPLHLRDYHRETLLRGDVQPEEEEAPPTYAQQQDNMRKSIIEEMHAAADNESGSEAGNDGDEDTGFLVKRQILNAQEKISVPNLSSADVAAADKNPEEFLSKFLNTRGWVAPSGHTLHPFESDDEVEDDRAEEFEQAYNLRFENPQTANEKLVTHARDTAAKYSVRQEPVNKRKRARESEREKKESAKQEMNDEKARLRKLRLEEAESKLKRIREAAGMGKRPVNLEEWQNFLAEDWDDDRWETEMKRKFGDDYYADPDHAGSDSEGEGVKKAKKPKWDDDIDITDLVSDFHANDDATFSLSEGEKDGGEGFSKSQNKKQKAREREDQKREARKERRKVEQLVDEKLDLDFAVNGTGKKSSTIFRYRETSPVNFGLTPKDILMASDSQLNQFHGLKKIASFRDDDKKRKDKKRLGKKARLRQWRKDTFGNESGPSKSLQDLVREEQGNIPISEAQLQDQGVETNIREGKRRKRTKKKTTST